MEWEKTEPKTRKLKEEEEMLENKEEKKKKSVFVVLLCSLMVSLSGGLLLTWWQYKFHPNNRQLWMVPPGLILFLTPVFVSFSFCLSDFCDRENNNNNNNDLER